MRKTSTNPEVSHPQRQPLLRHKLPDGGAPRIHRALLKLGIQISESSISKYMVRHAKPPSHTWRTFLKNHAAQLVSVDFFTVTAIALQPSTLLNFHRALVQLLFSPKREVRPGPKGPDADIIRVVVEMKQRNPTWGCPRIADQITLAFGTSINRDVVRRILALRYRPEPNSRGPSWLTFLGHMKDSLWRLDLFRCESVALQTYWVLVVMDQYTRRIIGFGILNRTYGPHSRSPNAVRSYQKAHIAP